MLHRLAAVRSAVRQALAAADRDGFSAFRWARLWLTVQRQQPEAAVTRRWVEAERAFQRRLWTEPPVPAWAALLLPPEPAPATESAASVPNIEADNLRRLVLALDASRGDRVPLSVRARDWAGGRPGLGERWADGALVRLGELGVLTKGPGVRRLPTWHLPAREEAIRRLDDAFGAPRT